MISKFINSVLLWVKNMWVKIIRLLFGYNPDNGTGAGSVDAAVNYGDFKLVRAEKDVIGVGCHRTGWPWVFGYLSTIESKNGIIFDDFFEQNFCYTPNPVIYKEPWITIIHHPKSIPSFGNYKENLSAVFEMDAFKESSKELKLVVALSDELAVWLRTQLDCKVVSLKHPIDVDQPNEWDYDAWCKNKTSYQIGFYLRNTRLIEQIPNVEGVEFNRLWSDMDWLQIYDGKVSKYWDNLFKSSFDFRDKNYFNARYKYREAGDHSVKFALPSKYDEILRTSVVLVEYFECSASNVILECIAGNTPIIVNRLPSTVQYLGEDYPLFFDSPEEIPDLYNKIEEANLYLKALDKRDINIEGFMKNILKEVNQIKK